MVPKSAWLTEFYDCATLLFIQEQSMRFILDTNKDTEFHVEFELQQ